MLTACRQEQLSLPVTHAAVSQPQSATAIAPAPPQPSQAGPSPARAVIPLSFCGPKTSARVAVQARLKQADAMVAALDSRTIRVDLVGDHANILSLQFPVRWPAPPSYSDRVSAVVENYFSSPDVRGRPVQLRL